MQAKSRAALVAARGEEGVAGLALDVGPHAGAVVGKDQLDIVMAAGFCRNRDGSGTAVDKSMVNGIEEQVGQDLAIGARIAVDDEAFGYVERQLDRPPLQNGAQACDDLIGGFAQAELAPLGMRAVDRDLLEGL